MQTIVLDLVPNGVFPVVYLSQYDVGRQFRIYVTDGGMNADFTGKDVLIRGRKPDQHPFVYSSAAKDGVVTLGQSASNTVTVTTTEQMTAAPFKTICELVVMDDKTQIASLNFILDVEEAAMPNDVELSDSDISTMEQLVSEATSARRKTGEDLAAVQQIVDNFNNGAWYSNDITLSASGWQGSEAPYSYTVTDVGAKQTVYLDLIVPGTTEDQLSAIYNARLHGSTSNIIYAIGVKPTIDIPIRLIYVKGD